MKYFKSLGLCLVAVFALNAVAAASASATEPVFLFALSTATGDFSSKTAGGRLKTINGHKVECTSATNTGRAVPETDKVERVLIVFSGCRAELQAGSTVPCKSSGQGKEVIKTEQLKGNLGYIEEGTGEHLKVGLVLLPEASEGLFAEFKCEEGAIKETIKVRGRNGGGVIAAVLPNSIEKLIGNYNKDEKEDTPTPGFLTYNEESAGIQQYRSLKVLGKLVDELLLETKIGGAAREWELSSIQEEENVEIFFLDSVKIMG